ncbi:MAG: 50S ribosomal protein L11 methyltransferase [Chloroflexota bacterium]
MDWLEVRVLTDGEGAEAVAETLRPFAYSEGVVLEQLGDMTTADPDALESTITVKIYIPKEEDTTQKRTQIEDALHYLGRLYPIPPPTFHLLKEQDWANAWKSHYKPFRIGKHVWIQPSWIDMDAPEASDLQPDDIILTLDPGMAFGTGLHPTTQMCILFIEQYLKPKDTILDVGTGSGILSIAAAKLGSGPIVAFDTDELAIKTTHENAEINGVHHLLKIDQKTLDEYPIKPYNMVLVNILAPIIINLFKNDRLIDYLIDDGVLILSGIIDEQLADVETAVIEAGGRIIETKQTRDWVCLAVKKGDF